MPKLLGSPVLAPNGDGRLEVFNFAENNNFWRITQTTWSGDWSSWISTPSGTFNEWPAFIGRNGDGRLIALAVEGQQGSLAQFQQAHWSNGWSSQWTLFGPSPGGSINPPVFRAGADGRLILFASTTGNGGFPGLWHLEQDVWGGSWDINSWSNHFGPNGRPVIGPPAMTLDAQGCLQVFVVSADGDMWNVGQTAPAGSWTDWNPVGGASGATFRDRPAVTASADGRLELFVCGEDNQLWHAWQTSVGGGWSEWVNFGNNGIGFQDHPTVATNADGRLEIFMTGGDGRLWHAWQVEASGQWFFWQPLGSYVGFSNAPAVAPSGDGRFEVFVVGYDGTLHHIWQTQASSNEWSGWISHGAPA
jgi:hypothetical protein